MVRKLLEMISDKMDDVSTENTKSGTAKVCGLSFLEGMIDGCFVVGALAFLAGLFGKKPEKK